MHHCCITMWRMQDGSQCACSGISVSYKGEIQKFQQTKPANMIHILIDILQNSGIRL